MDQPWLKTCLLATISASFLRDPHAEPRCVERGVPCRYGGETGFSQRSQLLLEEGVIVDGMVTVEIEFCVPCGLLEPALRTQRELIDTFGRDLDAVSLQPGHGGVFIVTVDEDVIFDRGVHGPEIAVDVIVDAVGNRVSTDA